jgi:hypothetical protein
MRMLQQNETQKMIETSIFEDVQINNIYNKVYWINHR